MIKQTALAQGGRAAQLAQQGDATARRLRQADASHQATIKEVRRALKRCGLSSTELTLHELNAARRRQLMAAAFVITIGGDGTLLNASHYVRAGVMLGVNSAPGDSVGHFCAVSRADVAQRLEDILTGAWRPTALARLAIALDEKPLPELALNDVLIAHDCPAATTRYLLRIGEVEEEHRSSGIWVATAAGSTAAIRSAGGRKMPLHSRQIQYRVRELYREVHGGEERDYQLTSGFVAPESPLFIASKMPEGWLFVDGARTAYRFPFGTRATIRLAAQPLRLFRP